jgi:large subunit ribosomal protein L23
MKQEQLLKVLISPRISEKSNRAGEKFRQFVFNVLPSATKFAIRRAVEHLFSVEVEEVCVCNVKGKQKVFKQVAGRRKNGKKAYVKLKAGHDIDFIGERLMTKKDKEEV